MLLWAHIESRDVIEFLFEEGESAANIHRGLVNIAFDISRVNEWLSKDDSNLREKEETNI